MDTLLIDAVVAISGHLCYVDAMTLKLTCRRFKNIPLPDFRNIVIQKLRECGIPDPESFNDKLLETGSVMSGSFLLDCIYYTDHHEDIDVYEPSTSTTYASEEDYASFPDTMPFTHYLTDNGYTVGYYDSVNREDGPHPWVRDHHQ